MKFKSLQNDKITKERTAIDDNVRRAIFPINSLQYASHYFQDNY